MVHGCAHALHTAVGLPVLRYMPGLHSDARVRTTHAEVLTVHFDLINMELVCTLQVSDLQFCALICSANDTVHN